MIVPNHRFPIDQFQGLSGSLGPSQSRGAVAAGGEAAASSPSFTTVIDETELMDDSAFSTSSGWRWTVSTSAAVDAIELIVCHRRDRIFF
jgi:hypothetical protein